MINDPGQHGPVRGRGETEDGVAEPDADTMLPRGRLPVHGGRGRLVVRTYVHRESARAGPPRFLVS